MAYEFKRSEKIQEEIKTGDTVISINLDVDTIAKEFNKRYNAIIAAELELKRIQSTELSDSEKLNTAMEVYGGSVIELFGLVFGEEGTSHILKFYENNYFEMTVEVFPFIINVIVPKIQQSITVQRERMAQQYKQKQASLFGLNRSQRRKMGLM